ncbi:MAG: gamma-glutamyl-gamma-aminobutyrate hydrolase family protein [Candidatus Hydrogenedentota bacterium]
MPKPALHAILALFMCLISVAAWAVPDIALVYTEGQMRTLARGKPDPLALYRDAVEAQGAQVMVFSPAQDAAAQDTQLAGIEGVCLPGGCDVAPARYGAEPDPNLERVDEAKDALELALLRHAEENALPVLGICRGHQIMNVFYGGTLTQDIPTTFESLTGVEVIHRKGAAMHGIGVAEGTMLRALLGTARLTVNSYHHQGVERLGEGLVISARSDDGLPEAIEKPGDRFVLGVQFHPEKMRAADPRMDRLFARFVEEARAQEQAMAQE